MFAPRTDHIVVACCQEELPRNTASCLPRAASVFWSMSHPSQSRIATPRRFFIEHLPSAPCAVSSRSLVRRRALTDTVQTCSWNYLNLYGDGTYTPPLRYAILRVRAAYEDEDEDEEDELLIWSGVLFFLVGESWRRSLQNWSRSCPLYPADPTSRKKLTPGCATLRSGVEPVMGPRSHVLHASQRRAFPGKPVQENWKPSKQRMRAERKAPSTNLIKGKRRTEL